MRTGIDQAIDRAIAPIAERVASFIFYSVEIGGADVPLIVVWLMLGGLFFTVYLGFLNIRGFGHAVELVRGIHADPTHPGEVSHFQALTTAVSGTVGIGNIGGVAITLSLGGPGAAFWLLIAGLLGMTTKCVECVLGVKYRRVHDDGTVSGGPMYVLERGLAEKGWPIVGRALGLFYAASIVVGCLGIGNMFQSNQAFAQFVAVTGAADSPFVDKGWLFGTILAAVVGVITIGGIQSIGRVTARLVPFMIVFYLAGALLVIALNAAAIPAALAAILEGAFTAEGVAGGALGAMILGTKRAVFSNEAGLGSAAIAHAAVRTDEPATEGYVGLLEPFIDTVVVCSITALVLTTSPVGPSAGGQVPSGIELTSAAFASTIPWSPYPLAVAALLFAFSTLLSWSYYGLKGWTYLFGEGQGVENAFKLIFCVFVALGASIELASFLDLADALIYVMALPNILGMYILAPVAKRELDRYRDKIRRRSESAHS